MNHRLLLVPLLAGAVLAQDPSAAADARSAARFAWPTDHVPTDVAADGSIWAATAAWKARFAADGATFVPCRGSDVPSAPVAFGLRSVRAGAAPVRVDAAMPRLAGQRITCERGGVREQFDLRQDGVEQSFVFATLPERGDLHLELAVQTMLAHAEDARGHTFTDLHGGVRYGHAVAIDAAGRRQPLATTWTGEALCVTVPAEFVASAVLPLVVDPLIGAIANATAVNTVALSSTDIAFDASLGQYFVCYERAFSSTDHDVFVVPLDAGMQSLAPVTIDFTGAYWAKPRIAVLEAHDAIGVVAEKSTGNVAPFVVGMRIVTGGAAPVAAAQFTAATALFGGDTLDPDVGGDANATGPARFLVAYESKDYQATSVPRCVTVDAAGVVGSPLALGIGNAFHRRLKVGKTCGRIGGNNEGWCIVHRSEVSGQIDGRLIAWFVRRDGTLRHPVGSYQYVALTGMTWNVGSDWDVSSPTDAANGRTFVCVERRLNLVTSNGALVAHAFDALGNVLTADVAVVGGAYDRRQPAVDSDGCRFVVAHTTVFSATDHDVTLRTLALVGGQLVTQDAVAVSTSLDRDELPAVCARTGVLNRYGATWTRSTAAAWTVQCQEYAGTGSGGIGTRTTACGGLTIGYSGTLALGDTFTVTVNHQTGIGLVVAGAPVSAPIPGCAGCTLGVDGTAFVGSQFGVQVPANPALVGSVVAFQGARWDPLLGPCLGMLAFSNTIDVVVR